MEQENYLEQIEVVVEAFRAEIQMSEQNLKTVNSELETFENTLAYIKKNGDFESETYTNMLQCRNNSKVRKQFLENEIKLKQIIIERLTKK